MSATPQSAAAWAERSAQWAAVALGFALPVSVALDNVLFALIVLLWLASAGYAAKWRALRGNALALPLAALFALLALGTLWGPAPWAGALAFLNKYRDLLLALLLLPLCAAPWVRQRALQGFLAAMLLTLALSSLIWLGVLPPTKGLALIGASHAAVFKSYITQGILMAFAAFAFALAARAARRRGPQVALALAALLAAFNVVAMIPGRTGYLVLAALAVYLLQLEFRWRGLVAGLAAVAALGVAAYAAVPAFKSRVEHTAQEYRAWQRGDLAASSLGQRIEFYRGSAQLIVERPLLGAGTGGFERAHAEQVRGTASPPTSNPHNDFLLVGAQLGLPGMALLGWLFVAQWRLAPRLATPQEAALARGLVLSLAIAGLFNSTLIDHTEGLFYAWMSGVLYGGLGPAAAAGEPLSRNA